MFIALINTRLNTRLVEKNWSIKNFQSQNGKKQNVVIYGNINGFNYPSFVSNKDFHNKQ